MLSSLVRLISRLLLLSPLCLLFIPLPLAESVNQSQVAIVAVVLIYGAWVLRFVGKFFSHRHGIEGRVPVLLLLIVSILLLILALIGVGVSKIALLVLAAVLFVSWGILSASEVRATGILSLLILIGTVSFIELFLNSVSPKIFDKSITAVKPLAPEVDRGILTYRKNGYRGRRPCKNCPDDNIRIFTIGGSSTYGLPLFYDRLTFSSVLQQLLDEGRPGENYEVLNAGIAGYGITQIYDSIKTELVKHKPDIILINSWFNDSASDMNWYGMTGKSDVEAYKLTLFMRWLQNFPPYKVLHESKLYNIYRWYLLKAQPHLFSLFPSTKKKTSHRTRMKPGEFKSMLDDIFKLSEQHGFMPILMFEPLNRTAGLKKALKRNDYYQAVAEAAEENDVPLVNSLRPIYERRSDWLYYDFIHPNHEGHKLLGDEIYKSLFDPENQTKRSKALWDSKGIKLDRPKVKRAKKILIDSDNLSDGKLRFNASIPYSNNKEAKLELSLNGKRVSNLPGLNSEVKSFEFSLNRKSLLPLNKAVLRARFDTSADESFLIGDTGKSSPVHLRVVSGGKDYGWRSEVVVQGVAASPNQRGYNIVVLSGDSGEVLSIKHFDIFGSKENNKNLSSFFSGLDQFIESKKQPVVIVSVKTDGIHNADTDLLTQAFKKIGASGKLPNPFESYAVVGILGAKPGTALEKSGRELIEFEIGDKELVEASLLEVKLEK